MNYLISTNLILFDGLKDNYSAHLAHFFYTLTSLLILFETDPRPTVSALPFPTTASLPSRHSKLDLVTEQFSSASNVNEKLRRCSFHLLRGSLFGIGIGFGFGFKPGSEKKELKFSNRRIPGKEDEKISVDRRMFRTERFTS